MSSSFSFDKIACPVCSTLISKGGAAYVSHLRSHVRKNEAIEHKSNGKLVFIPTNSGTYFEQAPYAKLGDDPLPGQPKGVWELPDLSKEFPVLDVNAYFTTSGEAVKKAERAVKDAYSLAVKLRAFYKKLQRARGERKYLETARDSGKLLIKAKDPRGKEEDKDK